MTELQHSLVAEIAPPKEDSESTKGKRQTIPLFSLTDILKFCIKIYSELGVNSYHPNDEIATIHHVVYASIKQKLSTTQEYGLLELKHGTGYKLTPLFMKIHKPVNDDERRAGILESLRVSLIYRKLIDEFNGHPLPSEQNLSSRLIRTFDVKEYAASKAALVFLNNLKDNGFVKDGQLRMQGSAVAAGDTPPPPDKNPPLGGGDPGDHRPPAQPGFIEIPIPLQGGGRAYLKIPENYKPEDCERIAKFVEALK